MNREEAERKLLELGYTKPEKEKKSALGRYAGITGRGAVKALATPFDILSIPYNLTAGQGETGPITIGENLASAYDYLTGNKFQPQNLGENILQSIPEWVGGAAVLKKAAPKIGGKVSETIKKFLEPKGVSDYIAAAGAGAGSEIGKELAPKHPGLGSFGGALLGGGVTGLGTNLAKRSYKYIGETFNPTETFKAQPEEFLWPAPLPKKAQEIPKEAAPSKPEAPVFPVLAEKPTPPIAPAEFNKSGAEAFQEVFNQPVKGRGEYTEEAIKNIGKKALLERKPINEAYANAEKGAVKASAGKTPFKDFTETYIKKLEREGLHVEDLPGIGNFIKTLEKEFNRPRITTKALEARRKQFSTLISRAEVGGAKEFGLHEAKNIYDDMLADIVENTLSESTKPGFAKKLEEFKEGRSLNHLWKKRYEGGNPDEFGKNYIDSIVRNARFSGEPLTPELLINKVLGASKLGFSPEAAAIVRTLKKYMSSEDFSSFKPELGQRLFEPLLNKEQFTHTNIKNFNQNIHSLLRNNKSLFEEVYTPSDIKKITKFGQNVDDAFKNEAQYAKDLKKYQAAEKDYQKVESEINKLQTAYDEQIKKHDDLIKKMERKHQGLTQKEFNKTESANKRSLAEYESRKKRINIEIKKRHAERQKALQDKPISGWEKVGMDIKNIPTVGELSTFLLRQFGKILVPTFVGTAKAVPKGTASGADKGDEKRRKAEEELIRLGYKKPEERKIPRINIRPDR